MALGSRTARQDPLSIDVLDPILEQGGGGRHTTPLGEHAAADEALHQIESALESGYVPHFALTREDRFFDPVRELARFQDLRARAEAEYRASAERFTASDGDSILGDSALPPTMH